MTTPSSDSRPDEFIGTTLGRGGVVDMTLEQFRTALRRSSAARRHIGLDISDRAAAEIAADEALSASWFKLWRTSVRTVPGHAAQTTSRPVVRPAAEQSEGDWLHELPMRFNPPPGWSMPSRDWVLQHMGLDMADVWRPPGAPLDDPVGWQWWIPQNPAWARWIEKEDRSYRHGALWAAALFPASILVGLFPWWTGGVAATLAIFGIVASALVGIFTGVLYRHYRSDPMGRFRDQHVDTLGTA